MASSNNKRAALPSTERRTYTVDETAAVLGVHRSTVYEYLKAGQLDARKLGRRTLIMRASLDKFIDNLPAMPVAATTGGAQ